MINILLIEDNPGDARLLEEELKDVPSETYTVTKCGRIGEAIKLLSTPHHTDVIISDIALPDSQGMQSFQKLRKVAADLPVVFYTGTHDEEMAVYALQRGAQDYLLKGQFDAETLRRSLRYAIERKKFQNEMERVRKRARRLKAKTTQLKRQGEQLVVLNRAKDDFISLASHQLRTPATGVKQYIGLLLEGYAGTLDDQQRQFLQLAYESNERQLKIVSDLLRTAQIDAGQVNLQSHPVEIGELLRQVVEEQSVQLRARDQHVKVEAPTGLPPVTADAGKLRMALENLVDNASKYTPHGKHIYVSAAQREGTAVITIRDEGVGIAQADQPKVFDKFSRISNALSNKVGGSGLGLYWVKQIISLHGGTITVSSTPHVGTSFIITLPAEV